MADDLLNVQEAAGFLRVHPNTLLNWRNSGIRQLPYIRIGKMIRYRKEDLIEFVNRHTIDPRKKPDWSAVIPPECENPTPAQRRQCLEAWVFAEYERDPDITAKEIFDNIPVRFNGSVIEIARYLRRLRK